MAPGIPPDIGASYVRWFLKRLKQKQSGHHIEVPESDEDTSGLPRGDGLALLIFLLLVVAGVVNLVYFLTSQSP